MGLVAEEGPEGGWGRWEVLADAGALEEDLGAMQLHAAGTRAGLTALQLSSVAPGADSSVIWLECAEVGVPCSVLTAAAGKGVLAAEADGCGARR